MDSYDDEHQELTSSEQPEKKKKASFKSVFEVLFAPTATFYHVRDAGHAWFFPFIIVVLTILLSMIVPDANIDNAQNIDDELSMLGGEYQSALMAIGIVFVVILIPLGVGLVWYVIPSLVFMLFGNYLFERRAKFIHIINTTVYATCPVIIQNMIGTIIAVTIGRNIIEFSPAVFLPVELHESFLGLWLSSLNLFSIWVVILLIIGLSGLFEHSRAKTSAWIIPLYLFATSFGAFFSSFAAKLSENMNKF